MNDIRKLQTSEIDVRVGSGGKDGEDWCTLLLYKDARVDQRLLDEVFTPMGWQREHTLIDGQLFCTVSIWDEDKKQWIKKQDVGVESMAEKEKGRASDAFKRACFNIGIGRELYSAPFIYIKLGKDEYNKGKLKTRFECKEIGYDEEGNINKLCIIDNNKVERFVFGMKGSAPKKNEPAPKSPYHKDTPELVIEILNVCKDTAKIKEVMAANPQFGDNQEVKDAANKKWKELNNKTSATQA